MTDIACEICHWRHRYNHRWQRRVIAVLIVAAVVVLMWANR